MEHEAVSFIVKQLVAEEISESENIVLPRFFETSVQTLLTDSSVDLRAVQANDYV